MSCCLFDVLAMDSYPNPSTASSGQNVAVVDVVKSTSSICPTPVPVDQYSVVNPNSFNSSASLTAQRNADWNMGINSAISGISLIIHFFYCILFILYTIKYFEE
jgi:hypothetical protein